MSRFVYIENGELPKKIVIYMDNCRMYGPYIARKGGKYLGDSVEHIYELDDNGNYIKKT